MSDGDRDAGRPTIDPALIAEWTAAAPGRVRRRLDADPAVAEGWTWSADSSHVRVETGGEMVTLDVNDRGGVVSAACTCLLSPRCFHVLACVCRLTPVATDDVPSDTTDDASSEADEETAVDRFSVEDPMRAAAAESLDALASLLVGGARGFGVVGQSTLLRCIHRCRTAGLVRLAGTLASVLGDVRRLRDGLSDFGADRLAADVASAVETAMVISSAAAVDVDRIGRHRRTFEPVGVRRLVGMFAEPVLTRGGYAGAVVTLAGDDGRTYRVVQSRPGGADEVRQVYRGGVELGELTLPMRRLCRVVLDVDRMTASADGRLGRGKSTRWAVREADGPWVAGLPDRWRQPLSQQVAGTVSPEVFDDSAGDRNRPVGFAAEVLGLRQDAVVVRDTSSGATLRLEPGDVPHSLPTIDNLRLIGRAIGLTGFILGRWSDRPDGIVPTMIAFDDDRSLPIDARRVVLPESWFGVCQLSLDRLRPEYLRGLTRLDAATWRGPDGTDPIGDDPTMGRYLRAMVLGGVRAVATASSPNHRRTTAGLRSAGRRQTADALDALAVGCGRPVSEPRNVLSVFLAVAKFDDVYRRSLTIQQRRALLLPEEEIT